MFQKEAYFYPNLRATYIIIIIIVVNISVNAIVYFLFEKFYAIFLCQSQFLKTVPSRKGRRRKLMIADVLYLVFTWCLHMEKAKAGLRGLCLVRCFER